MKKLLALLLAFSIISQNLVNVAIGVYYNVNKEYISKQLCINRNNPSMHCNGHCYLSKQLKKAQEGENKTARVFKDKDELITNNCQSIVVEYFPSYSELEFSGYNTIPPAPGNSGSLIKPPAA